MPEAIELLTGAAMRSEPGRTPPLEAPAAPTGATWELGQARQRFMLGTLVLDLRLETPWATAMPQIDDRAGPFCTSALQRELNAATAGLPSVRRLPHLEAASARAAAREARRAELAAERDRLLGEGAVPDDLADRLGAIDAELAPLASAAQVSRRLAEELDRGRARALRDASMIAQALNEKATGDLLNLRDGLGMALMQLPGLQEALYHLTSAIRLCEAASHTRLGDVGVALAAARQAAAAPGRPPDSPQGDAGGGGGPDVGPAPPDGPQATPAAPDVGYEEYLERAFQKHFEEAKKKAAVEDAPPPPPATPTNRISSVVPNPNGHVEPFPADDEAADETDADEIDADDAAASAEGDEGDPAEAEGHVDEFIRDQCTIGPTQTVLVQDLLAAFCRWCESRRLPSPASIQVFGRDLRRAVGRVSGLRLREGRRNTPQGRLRLYVGLALRTEAAGG
jgi:hypothetical protein